MAKKLPSKDRLALIWLGIISALTHLPWLVLLRNFTSGDWWYIGIERYRDFAQFSPVWVTDGIGNTSAVPHFYLIRFFEGILTFFGSSFMLNEKLFFLLPMTFAGSFGAYFLLRRYFSVWPAFIGALVFAFNTPVLFNHVGPLTIGVAYALAPWCVYFFKRYLEELTGRMLVAAALTLAGTIVYELRIGLIIVGMSMGLFVFNAVISEGWGYARQRLLPLAKFFGLVLLLHAFWVAPYVIASRSVTFSDLLSRGLFVSFSDIQNALTLHHPFWTGARPATFVVQDIPLYAWFIPVAAFGGFLLRWKGAAKEIYYWGIVAILGIFLVKQVNEPFINVYPWLFGNVPGFGAYRESSKFYLLVALSYAVLIPFTLCALRDFLERRFEYKHLVFSRAKVLYAGASALVVGLFLVNTIPLLTGSFRTLYIPRTMPDDYKTFESFVGDQDSQFRTLWVPVTSRWSPQTNKHPALVGTSFNQGAWLSQIGNEDTEAYATLRDKAIQLFKHQSANTALDRAGVKYVVVPQRDIANEDDFFQYYGDDRQYYIDQLASVPYLRQVDVGTKDLVVFENTGYQDYFSTFTDVQLLTLDKNIDVGALYDFTTKQLDQPFNFVTADTHAEQASYPANAVTNVFQDLSEKDISPKTVSKTVPAHSKPELYINPHNQSVSYEISNETITFYATERLGLTVNGTKLDEGGPGQTAVASATLDPDADYYLSSGNTPAPISQKEGTRSLGVLDAPLILYASAGKNSLQNGSFEQGLWQKQVQDCNNYDSQARIGMKLRGGAASDGSRSLELAADRHTACTQSASMAVTADEYLVSLDYKVDGGWTAGYEVVFDDPKDTVIREDVSTDDDRWHPHQQVVQVPEGATSFYLRLKAYPDYRRQNHAITGFDDIRIVPLDQAARVPYDKHAGYQRVALAANTDLTLAYPNNPQRSGNLVPNGSFSDGLWQKTVADCNNYDATPVLRMGQVKGPRDDAALELGAQRHDACTSNTATKVDENTNYIFSFDYQSPNASTAFYFVRFNDANQTTIEESIPIKDTDWHTFTRQIKAPLGATRVSIVAYARSSGTGNTMTLNRYDNFSLREIPSLAGQYYVVDRAADTLTKPKDVSFVQHSAVKKSVTINDATTPFYLRMSEAYHPLWKIRFGTAATSDWLTQAPWKQDNLLAESNHFKLNDFQNGWYIDPARLCADQSGCTKNADGSYDMRLVVEFTAQRWFHAGSVVSIITFVGCILFLVYGRTIHKPAEEATWRWRRR